MNTRKDLVNQYNDQVDLWTASGRQLFADVDFELVAPLHSELEENTSVCALFTPLPDHFVFLSLLSPQLYVGQFIFRVLVVSCVENGISASAIF